MPEFEQSEELIATLARVYEGNALRHITSSQDEQSSGRTQHVMLAASSFVLSASYWSMLRPRNAVAHYRRASEIYRGMGHSYWMPLALAGSDDAHTADMPGAAVEDRHPSPQAIAFAMIADAMRGDDYAGALQRHHHLVGNAPVGRLGIPLDHYAVCAESMRNARRHHDPEMMFGTATSFVSRAAEVIEAARHDRFHWTRLHSAILPAEPEAVAMTTAMAAMAHRMGTNLTELAVELPPSGRLLLETGEFLRRAAER